MITNMYKHSPSVIPVALVLGFGASAVQAGVCGSTSDVSITQIDKQDGTSLYSALPGVITASDCIVAGGRHPSSHTNFGDNNGFRGQGDLNTWGIDGGPYGEFGAFVEEDDLQALRDPNVAEDAGWIFVGKQDVGGSTEWGTINNGVNGESFSFSSVFDNFSDLLEINVGAGDDCNNAAFCGTWSYTPPEIPADLQAVIGDKRIFDQIAIVLKGGNSGNGNKSDANDTMIYNFTLADLAGAGIPGFDPLETYAYSGVWNTSGSIINNGGNSAGLSNFSAYLRDPVVGSTSIETPVPTPATLILFASGLIGLGAFQKRRA